MLIVLFVFSFSYKTRRAVMERLSTTNALVKGPRRVRLGSSSAETSYNSESMSWKIPEKVTLGSSFHKYFSFCAKSRRNYSWRKLCCIAKKLFFNVSKLYCFWFHEVEITKFWHSNQDATLCTLKFKYSLLVSTYVVCERLSVIQQQVCLVDFLSVTLSLSVTVILDAQMSLSLSQSDLYFVHSQMSLVHFLRVNFVHSQCRLWLKVTYFLYWQLPPVETYLAYG